MKFSKCLVAEQASVLPVPRPPKVNRRTSRRSFLLGVGASVGSFGILGHVAGSTLVGTEQERPTATIPFIHTTDIYNPPQDPDDHVDLATVFALPELDLRAVILDPTRKFVEQQDPGFVPVAQLNYLTGRAVPVAAGPIDPLQSPSDTAKDRPRHEQAGIELLLNAMRQCNEPGQGTSRRVDAANAGDATHQLRSGRRRSCPLVAQARAGQRQDLSPEARRGACPCHGRGHTCAAAADAIGLRLPEALFKVNRHSSLVMP